jgi:hypothetical protein
MCQSDLQYRNSSRRVAAAASGKGSGSGLCAGAQVARSLLAAPWTNGSEGRGAGRAFDAEEAANLNP